MILDMQMFCSLRDTEKQTALEWGNYIKLEMTRRSLWLIKISVSQNPPDSNESSYRAGDTVKNRVKRHSQMNFHSVKIFPRDVNCRKRDYSGSTLLHVCLRTESVMGSQSPTSKTLSHFWLLGSKYEHGMDPQPEEWLRTRRKRRQSDSQSRTFSH